jgi:ubiquitin-conjugating enzyme E2 variant
MTAVAITDETIDVTNDATTKRRGFGPKRRGVQIESPSAPAVAHSRKASGTPASGFRTFDGWGPMSARWKAFVDRVSVTTFVVAWTVMFVRIAPAIFSEGEWLAALFGVVAGYLLADFLTGLVHWIADRFFDPETPVLGPMLIGPFRDHHEDALGITRHDFFEVSGNNALVTIPLVVFIAARPTPVDLLPQILAVLGASLTLAVFVTNQFHSWAHSPSPPGLVRRLHASGLILTPKRHARHHRNNRDGAYCVTSGWLNPLLDRIRFFERMERMIDARPGRRRRTT